MTDDHPLEKPYSLALDEVYRLRGLLAYYARVTEAHLDYKTFPKSRREIAERQIENMRRAARGEAWRITYELPSHEPKRSLREAGASETLTRYEFEEQQ